MDELLSSKLSHYQVLEELGRGGFAAVYKALDTRSNRIVALKILAPHLTWDEGFVARFQREARTVASLRHPNIVAIYEVGQADGKHFIAMDFLEGLTLKQLIDQEGALPLERAAHIIQQLASALDYAHQRGVVHRDIKPSNIIIGPDDHVTLTDFGIVKATEGTRLTSTGVTLGTPEYMSPEQGQGLDVDRRSDIYSLGVVLYEMLTGRVPFSGTTPLAVLHKHVYETASALHALNARLPHWVEAVVGKALAKDPKDRYSTAGEMAAAVSGGERLAATLAAPLIREPGRRRRTLPVQLWASALAAVVVILVITAAAVLKHNFVIPLSEPTTVPLAARASQTPTETAAARPSAGQTQTGTAIATPTAQSSPTLEASPTLAATPTTAPPTPTLPAWTLVQGDNLDTPSPDFPESSDEHYRLFYQDGRYGIESNWGPSAFAWQSRGSFSDFMAEVDITPQKEAGLAGLILRRNGQQFYFFGISHGRQYGFAKRMGQGGENWYQIIPWLESPYITPAPGTNHLQVVCQGPQIALYINDHFVDSVQDATFSQGQVGVLAGTHGEDYALSFFDNLKVYVPAAVSSLPSPDTTPPRLLWTSPADGEVGVSRYLERITLTSTEPMQHGWSFNHPGNPECWQAVHDVGSPTFVLRITLGDECGEYHSPGATLTITTNPSGHDNCRDLAGNPAVSESFSFAIGEE